jgi:predicted Zn-dependent protease
MSLRKTISYIALIVSVLLLLKIFVDRNQSSEPTPSETPVSAADVAPRQLPINYTLGTFDSRFGITQERFLQIAAEAIKVWEDAAGRKLFLNEQEASIKLNLVFDWRQEKLLEVKEQKAKIDERGQSFDLLQSQYEEKGRAVDQMRGVFEESADSYKNHLAEYNARVARWNEGSNHSDAEYQYLQTRKKELEDEQSAVEKRRAELNAKGEELNRAGESMTELSKKYNLDVANFNGSVVQSRDFEKGVYDGSAINIYEFEKEGDLKLTLIHEFGHALGFNHVENPKAIMNRKLAFQDVNDIHLTSDDLNLLLARIK